MNYGKWKLYKYNYISYGFFLFFFQCKIFWIIWKYYRSNDSNWTQDTWKIQRIDRKRRGAQIDPLLIIAISVLVLESVTARADWNFDGCWLPSTSFVLLLSNFFFFPAPIGCHALTWRGDVGSMATVAIKRRKWTRNWRFARIGLQVPGRRVWKSCCVHTAARWHLLDANVNETPDGHIHMNSFTFFFLT